MQDDLDVLEREIDDQLERVEAGIEYARRAQLRGLRWFQILQVVFVGVMLAVTLLILWIGRGIIRRVGMLAVAADRITAGELALEVGVGGGDELATLAGAFNTMTERLRQQIEAEQASRAQSEGLLDTEKEYRARIEELLRNVREAVAQLSSAGAEILASTSQQAAGAEEQAAAVSQTVATVEQVTQTADQAAQRAKGVGDAVQQTMKIGRDGRTAVEDSIAALNRLKEQVESTAEDILALAEQAQAIGEIIATVNDIAEQTNVLALNAAIEASRAGEQGRGFAVVAGEVKALADQSKKATAQVRQILGEIQKATNAAVLSMEQVTKGVDATIATGGQSGEAIRTLAETLETASRAASQIVASAGQQATGMSQIDQAMRNLEQVAQQNLAATRQVEQAAQDLNALGHRLAELAAE